jgi:biopolymer transport protein ExbD
MPKVKMKRSSPLVDMTAMCDVAFLLLTFFILTSKFRPQDPVQIDMPGSESNRKISEKDIQSIQISKDGRVFWGTENQLVRAKTLEIMKRIYPNVKFTPDETEAFKKIESFGCDFVDLPKLLSGEIKNDDKSEGIPVDSLESKFTKNELKDWLQSCRQAHLDITKARVDKESPGTFDIKNGYEYIRLAVKGDGITEYPKIDIILNTLKDCAINKFDLITSLKGGESASKGGGSH